MANVRFEFMWSRGHFSCLKFAVNVVLKLSIAF